MSKYIAETLARRMQGFKSESIPLFKIPGSQALPGLRAACFRLLTLSLHVRGDQPIARTVEPQCRGRRMASA